MYTLFIRDEQGNMKVLRDWHRGDLPYLMSPSDCASLARRLRQHFPNATAGLELAYHYTGDDWSPARGVRVNESFEGLPEFPGFFSRDRASEPDASEPRSPLERTVPAARTREWVKRLQGRRKALPFRCGCGWSGTLGQVADCERESRFGLEWTCPSCGEERYFAMRPAPPICAES